MKSAVLMDKFSNKLKNEEAEIIVWLFECMKVATALKLFWKNYENTKTICEMLKQNRTIKSLDFYYYTLESEEINIIGEMLKTNRTLTELELSNNNISTEGIKVICETLQPIKQ